MQWMREGSRIETFRCLRMIWVEIVGNKFQSRIIQHTFRRAKSQSERKFFLAVYTKSTWRAINEILPLSTPWRLNLHSGEYKEEENARPLYREWKLFAVWLTRSAQVASFINHLTFPSTYFLTHSRLTKYKWRNDRNKGSRVINCYPFPMLSLLTMLFISIYKVISCSKSKNSLFHAQHTVRKYL